METSSYCPFKLLPGDAHRESTGQSCSSQGHQGNLLSIIMDLRQQGGVKVHK